LNISVLGCGRWGGFIAWYLSSIGHRVFLWGKPGLPEIGPLMATRSNEWLRFDDKVVITDNLDDAIEHGSIIVISISSQNLRGFAKELTAYDLNGKTFVLCMKGLEEVSGKRLTEVFTESVSAELQAELQAELKVAVWVGPGHVQDYIRGIPNCMVIDSLNGAVKDTLVPVFSSKLIRFYYGNDLIGNEIGAASKNVIGIAAGMLDGLEYVSLKGALMARGANEISRLIKAAGGDPRSAFGLCHLGDYEATLFSHHSQNRMFGESYIKGQAYSRLAEGASTVKAIMKMCEKYEVELPICQTVNSIIHEKMDARDLLDNLFSRSIKSEFV